MNNRAILLNIVLVVIIPIILLAIFPIISAKKMASFKITNSVLHRLDGERIPVSILSRLEGLVDQDFTTNFELTESSLSQLESSGVPTDVIHRLGGSYVITEQAIAQLDSVGISTQGFATLLNQEYFTKDEFLATLSTVMDTTAIAANQEVILDVSQNEGLIGQTYNTKTDFVNALQTFIPSEQDETYQAAIINAAQISAKNQFVNAINGILGPANINLYGYPIIKLAEVNADTYRLPEDYIDQLKKAQIIPEETITKLETIKGNRYLAEITDQAIDELKEEDIPEDLVSQLESLKGQTYHTEEELIADLEETIGEDQVEPYQSFFIKHVKETGGQEFMAAVQEAIGDENTTKYGSLIMSYAEERHVFMGFFPIDNTVTFFAVLMMLIIINKFAFDPKTHAGEIREVLPREFIREGIGRCAEMGRPCMFIPGTSYPDDVATIAGLAIGSVLIDEAIDLDIFLDSPQKDYMVMPITKSLVEERAILKGRPDYASSRSDVFLASNVQFTHAQVVAGRLERDRHGFAVFAGMFWAEMLIMLESATMNGAMVLSGVDSVVQMPFAVAASDRALLGEELYAAGAQLSEEKRLVNSVVAQDLLKSLLFTALIVGAIYVTIIH